MINLDVAMGIIFAIGLFGCAVEPWSPHPKLMILVAIIYFCVRITALMIGNYRFGKERRKER